MLEQLESGAKIIVFHLEGIQPFTSLDISSEGGALFRQHRRSTGMGAPGRPLFRACRQFFQRIFANRFLHHEARFPLRLLDLPYQTLVHH